MKHTSLAGWRSVALGEVCAVINGGTPKSQVKAYWDGEVQWLTPKDMGQMQGREIGETPRTITQAGLDNSSARLVPPQSVILSTRAPIGHLAVNTVPMAFNQGCRGLVPSDALDHLYLYHFLSASKELLQSLGTGTTFKELSSGNLKQVQIPLPPLEEQRRIVAILDEAFEGLARARANAEANLQNARHLLDSVRETTLAPEKNPNLSLRPLSEIINIKHGFAFKSTYFAESGEFVVLTPGNYYETGGYRDRGKKQKYYSGEIPEEFLLKSGDLLMAMTEQAPGLLGSCIVVPEDGRFLHNQRLGLVSPRMGVTWCARYFYHVFNLQSFRKHLSDTCSGATVRHTSPSRIQQAVVPYTSTFVEQEAVAAKLSDVEEATVALESHFRSKMRDLNDLRESILRKAFSGDLR